MARKTQCDTSLPSNFSAISNWNSFAIKSFTSWIFISCTELDVSFSPMVVNKQQTKNKEDQFKTVTSSLAQFMGGMNNAGIKHGIFTVIPQRDWLIKKKLGCDWCRLSSRGKFGVFDWRFLWRAFWNYGEGSASAGYLRAGNSALLIFVFYPSWASCPILWKLKDEDLNLMFGQEMILSAVTVHS